MTQDKETLREAVAFVIFAAAFHRNDLLNGTVEKKWAKWATDRRRVFAQADAAIATMFERLRTPSLRCEPANGATLKEMRENLSTELKDAGDCRLVWVNEGDLAMLDAFQQENSDA